MNYQHNGLAYFSDITNLISENVYDYGLFKKYLLTLRSETHCCANISDLE